MAELPPLPSLSLYHLSYVLSLGRTNVKKRERRSELSRVSHIASTGGKATLLMSVTLNWTFLAPPEDIKKYDRPPVILRSNVLL